MLCDKGWIMKKYDGQSMNFVINRRKYRMWLLMSFLQHRYVPKLPIECAVLSILILLQNNFIIIKWIIMQHLIMFLLIIICFNNFQIILYLYTLSYINHKKNIISIRKF